MSTTKVMQLTNSAYNFGQKPYNEFPCYIFIYGLLIEQKFKTCNPFIQHVQRKRKALV